jgi:potassium-dependent mechanosensitive channel
MYNPIARLIVEVECSYDDDPDKVKEILLSIADGHDEIIKDPAPSVLFDNFNSSGLLFKLRVFCLTANRTSLSSKLCYIIFDKFKENGIEIPYPKQDIYKRA